MRVLSGVTIDESLVQQTIFTLQDGGARSCETVVLWLGTSSEITEVYKPEQNVDVDYFRIPSESMRALMAHVRQSRKRVIAQVHSHPGEAFHSEADDHWAIVRHEGALSLVVPEFAVRTSVASFMDDVATYVLDADDHWHRVITHDHIALK